jgi:hypothetical protein
MRHALSHPLNKVIRKHGFLAIFGIVKVSVPQIHAPGRVVLVCALKYGNAGCLANLGKIWF